VARKSGSDWTAPTLVRTAFDSRTLTDLPPRGLEAPAPFFAADFFAADFLAEFDLVFRAVDLAMALSRAQCIAAGAFPTMI
jgi:hypothetical protein